MIAALSLAQAPPLSVPLRFFLTAPLFGMAAALVLLWAGPEALNSRWMPGNLALSHLLGLGVLTMVMFGALLQLQPVLIGVNVAKPRLLAGLCHLGLTLGSVVLTAGFLFDDAWLFQAAMPLLGSTFLLFIVIIGVCLARAPMATDSVKGARWALLALLIASVLGLVLVAGHAFPSIPLWRQPLTDVHVSWALVGWVGILVASVAWQVVPMFQMTAEFPALLRGLLAPGIAAGLLALSVVLLLGLSWAVLPILLLAGVLFAFSISTLVLLVRRRRKASDGSLGFWYLGMVGLAAAALLAGIRVVVSSASLAAALELAAAVLFVGGFALSVVAGMLYKIVPFLVWLHLQQRLGACPAAAGKVVIPNARTVVPESMVRAHLGLQFAALLVLIAGLMLPQCLRLAAVLWLASFALLGYNLLVATLAYCRGRRRIDRLSLDPA